MPQREAFCVDRGGTGKGADPKAWRMVLVMDVWCLSVGGLVWWLAVEQEEKGVKE